MDKETELKIIKEKALAILTDVSAVMPKSFLILGTALGAVREKDFIVNGMFDIDIGVMSEDFEWRHITELIRNGFDLRLVLGKRNYGMSVHLTRDDIHTDILIFYPDEHKVWSISWFQGIEIHHEFSKEAFKPEEHYVFGKKFWSLGEKYVKEYYGENWNIPQETFDWLNEPCSVKELKEDPQFIETGFNIYMNKDGKGVLEKIIQKKNS